MSLHSCIKLIEQTRIIMEHNGGYICMHIAHPVTLKSLVIHKESGSHINNNIMNDNIKSNRPIINTWEL